MSTDPQVKPFYSPRDLAERWCVSIRTIHREVDRGRLKSKMIGGQLRFPVEEVERYEAEA